MHEARERDHSIFNFVFLQVEPEGRETVLVRAGKAQGIPAKARWKSLTLRDTWILLLKDP